MQIKTLVEHFFYGYPLTDAQHAMLTTKITMRSVKKNEFVVRVGDTTDLMALVVEGVFRLFYIDRKGKEITRNFCIEGDLVTPFGSLLQCIPAYVAIQALTDATVVSTAYATLCELFPTDLAWQITLRKLVEKHYVLKETRECELLLLDAKERFEIFTKQFPGLMTRISQRFIAQYLNISPEHLCRLRSKK